MRVTLLYFAALRELRGLSEETVELPSGVERVGELAGHLERVYPALGGRLGQVRFALNECFAYDHDPLTDGAVVALIPPVSGG